MELQWLGARDEEVVQLHCTVKLDGAKPPRNEFVLRDMYHQQSDHRLSTHYPSMQKGLKRRLIDMCQEVCKAEILYKSRSVMQCS